MPPKSTKAATSGVANPALQARLIDQQEELLERPNFVRLKFLGTGVQGAKAPPPKGSTKDVRVHSLEELSRVVDDWLGAPGSWQLSTAANWPLAVDTLLRPSSKQCPLVVNIRNTQEDGLDQALHRQLELEARMQREVERRQAEVGRCLRRIDELERSILEVKSSRHGELHVQDKGGAKQAAMRQCRKCLVNLGSVCGYSFVPGVAVVATCLVVYLLLSISSEVVSQGIIIAQDEEVITGMRGILHSAGWHELPSKLNFMEGNISKLHKKLHSQVNRLDAEVHGNMHDVRDAVREVANTTVQVKKEEEKVKKEEEKESIFRRKEDFHLNHSLEEEEGKMVNITDIAEEAHEQAIRAEAFAHDLASKQASHDAYVNRTLDTVLKQLKSLKVVGLESLNHTVKTALLTLEEEVAELEDLKNTSQAMAEGLQQVNSTALEALHVASEVNVSAKERQAWRAVKEAKEAMKETSRLRSINATVVAAQLQAAQAAKDIAAVNQTVNSNMQNGTEELKDMSDKLTGLTRLNHEDDLKLEKEAGELKADVAHSNTHLKRELDQVAQVASVAAQAFGNLNASVVRDAARTLRRVQRVEAKADEAEQDFGDLNASVVRDAAHTRRGLQRVEAKADEAEQDFGDLNVSVVRDAARTRLGLQRVGGKADKVEQEYGELNASVTRDAGRTQQRLRQVEAKADAAEQGYDKLNASLIHDIARARRGLQIAEAKANAAEQEYGELDKSVTREAASMQRSLQLAKARADREKQDIVELNTTVSREHSVGQQALRHALDVGREVSKLNESVTGEHAVVQQALRRALDVRKDLGELNRSLVAERTIQQQALHRAVTAAKGDLQTQMRHVTQEVAATQGKLERINQTASDASSVAKAAMLGLQRQELEERTASAAAPAPPARSGHDTAAAAGHAG